MTRFILGLFVGSIMGILMAGLMQAASKDGL